MFIFLGRFRLKNSTCTFSTSGALWASHPQWETELYQTKCSFKIQIFYHIRKPCILRGLLCTIRPPPPPHLNKQGLQIYIIYFIQNIDKDISLFLSQRVLACFVHVNVLFLFFLYRIYLIRSMNKDVNLFLSQRDITCKCYIFFNFINVLGGLNG